ncbi:hypothetical protein SUSAZ_04290 [Sulfolobus acidocaldarius SUSAZ]|nr:hypothetical protein SUSAZ_04290 [Sulfolobus acidocaldarius SUSAZ]
MQVISMNSLLSLVRDLCSSIIDHYGKDVKGILIAGDALEKMDEDLEIYIIAVISKLRRVSFLARQEIIEYFINKLKNNPLYKEYILSYGHRPLIYSILIDPDELDYNMSIVLYAITRGKILLDTDNKIKNLLPEKISIIGKSVMKVEDIDKGKVVDL